MAALKCGVSRGALLVSLVALNAPLPAFAVDTTVSTSTTTAQTVTAGNNLIVTGPGAVSPSTNPAVSVNGGVAASSITNSGTIQSTGTGARGIRFVTSTTANVTITNNVGAVIQSQSDTIQSNVNLATGTIVINNYGLIQATGTGGNNGQAIDLANVVAGTASFTINNFSTGVITAADADAIRAPQNVVLNNAGLIYSQIGTAANGNASGNDAIDFQGNTGTVNNLAGGVIRSVRHGITGDLGITVNNSGTIIGLDGSGINVDSTTNASITTVVNRGTITGTAVTADGDGIDVDRLLNLDNYGTIRGNGIGGAGNLSEGLAIGGGTINNYAGALIYGAQRAITVDDSNLGNAFAAVTINNAGTIQGGTGDAIKITSTFNNSLTNSGTILGNVAMGSGDDTVTIRNGSRIVGTVDGGANTGAGDTLVYQKIGLTAEKIAALQAGQTVNIGGTLYTGFENFTGSTVRSFSSFATTAQTTGVAAILDNLSATQSLGSGSQSVIDAVASAGDVNAALTQLTPAAFQGFSTAAINGAFQTTQLTGQRLANVRSGDLAFDAAGVDTALAMMSDRSRSLGDAVSAYAATPAQNGAFEAMARASSMPTKAPVSAGIGQSPWGMFLYGNAVFARQSATATAPQSRFTAAGITAGVDRRITENFVLGLLGGYTRTNADLDTLGSTSRIDTWLLGAYATYYQRNMFFNGAYVFGRNSYDTTRIAVGLPNTSMTHGNMHALQGSVGIDYAMGVWTLTPELGAQYTSVSVNAFTETGAAALAVQSDRTDSFRSSLGARLRYTWLGTESRVTPELRASWQHEFLNKDRDIRASFVDQALPGTFATTAAGAGTDFGVVGAGLLAQVADRTQLSVGYDYKFGGHDFSAHQLSARLRHLF